MAADWNKMAAAGAILFGAAWAHSRLGAAGQRAFDPSERMVFESPIHRQPKDSWEQVPGGALYLGNEFVSDEELADVGAFFEERQGTHEDFARRQQEAIDAMSGPAELEWTRQYIEQAPSGFTGWE